MLHLCHKLVVQEELEVVGEQTKERSVMEHGYASFGAILILGCRSANI